MKYLITLLVGILFLVGCSQELIQENVITGAVVAEKLQIKEESNFSENKEISAEKLVGDEPKEQVEESYSADQLIDDMKEIIEINYYNFTRDPVNPQYIQSSAMQYYVIHTQQDKITTVEEFCDEYCAQNWNGWQFWMNMSWYSSNRPLMSLEDFDNEFKYKRYLSERTLFNHSIHERLYGVENGVVFEYQNLHWNQNQLGTFKWMYPLLLYKFPCSENMTIFISPRWEQYTIESITGKMPSAIKNWEYMIKPIREEILNWSNAILEKCPFKKSFFEGISQPDYYETEFLAYDWRSDFELFVNVTTDIAISVKPTKEEDEYYLTEVNVSVTNNDKWFDFYNVALRIEVDSDDRGYVEFYDKPVTRRFDQGKSISKRILKGKDELERLARKGDTSFKDHITIKAALYTEIDSQDIRPTNITFTKQDLGLE